MPDWKIEIALLAGALALAALWQISVHLAAIGNTLKEIAERLKKPDEP